MKLCIHERVSINTNNWSSKQTVWVFRRRLFCCFVFCKWLINLQHMLLLHFIHWHKLWVCQLCQLFWLGRVVTTCMLHHLMPVTLNSWSELNCAQSCVNIYLSACTTIAVHIKKPIRPDTCMIIGKKFEISGSNSNADDECSLLEWMAYKLVYSPLRFLRRWREDQKRQFYTVYTTLYRE